MTHEEIIRMAREAAFSEPTHPFITWGASDEQLERFAALVAAAEREACAKVCEEIKGVKLQGYEFAAAIRARVQT